MTSSVLSTVEVLDAIVDAVALRTSDPMSNPGVTPADQPLCGLKGITERANDYRRFIHDQVSDGSAEIAWSPVEILLRQNL